MVIVAKFWEVLNALFKIHNCAAAEDVVSGREEWAVCTFIDTAWRKKSRWFKDRRDPCVMLFSGYRRLLFLYHRMLSYFWVPFIPQPPTWQGNTWDKLRQKPAPHPAPSLGMQPPPLPQNRNTLSSEQNWEFPRGEPHWELKIDAGDCKAGTTSFCIPKYELGKQD